MGTDYAVILMRSAFAALSPPRATVVLGAIAGTGTSFVGWGAAQVLIPGLAGATIGATPLQAAALNLCALSAITATSAAVLQKGASAVDPWTALSIGVPAALCAPLGAQDLAGVSCRFSGAPSLLLKPLS